MDYKYIEQLLERYWNCETSLEEESILRNFFAQDNVPGHLERYKDMFLCQEMWASEGLSEDFDQRILALTEQKEEEGKVVKARKMRFSYGIRPLFKAAAMVAIVLSISMAMQQAIVQKPESTTIAVKPGMPNSSVGTAYNEDAELQPTDSIHSMVNPVEGRHIEKN